MSDSFSSHLRLRLQQTGGNLNQWGGYLNAAGLQLLEDALTAFVSVTIASADVTLTVANGATDQSRAAFLKLIGAPAGAFNVICPSIPKTYVVWNATGQNQTVKTATGTGVTVTSGNRQIVMCDGTNVLDIQANPLGTVANATNADELGGVLAANYARLDIFNVFAKGSSSGFITLADGATIAFDASLSNNFIVTLNGNRIFGAASNPHDGQMVVLLVRQDGTGNRTLTFDASYLFANAVPPVLSSAASHVDAFIMIYNQTLGVWFATQFGNLGGAGGASYNIQATGDASDFNLIARLGGSPGVASTINVTVNPGVIIRAGSPVSYAMDLSGLPVGSTVNLINNGYIIGKGGAGGAGACVFEGTGADTNNYTSATQGRIGGPAIKAPGTGITFNVTNGSGHIWGGGGGGGGGGASAAAVGGGSGGGGGGGAGGGAGGEPGKNVGAVATIGGEGGSGINGIGGAGGGGNQTGSGTGEPAGAGGTYGVNGTAGTAAPGSTLVGVPGAGGTAGKAVDLNAGPINWVSGSGAPNVLGAVS